MVSQNLRAYQAAYGVPILRVYTRVAPKNRSEGSNLIPRDHFETCREHVLYAFLFLQLSQKRENSFLSFPIFKPLVQLNGVNNIISLNTKVISLRVFK